MDMLTVDVQRKLRILQNGSIPDEGQVMPLAFVDQIGSPDARTEVTRHFGVPVACACGL